jgi:hypothetical protein
MFRCKRFVSANPVGTLVCFRVPGLCPTPAPPQSASSPRGTPPASSHGSRSAGFQFTLSLEGPASPRHKRRLGTPFSRMALTPLCFPCYGASHLPVLLTSPALVSIVTCIRYLCRPVRTGWTSSFQARTFSVLDRDSPLSASRRSSRPSGAQRESAPPRPHSNFYFLCAFIQALCNQHVR